MRLSIKSVIRWELMTGRPFYSLNYSNENDVVVLFYVCGSLDVTFDEYKKSLTEDEVKKQIEDFEKQNSIISQFQKKAAGKSNSGNNPKDETPVYVKDIVSILIMEGLSAHFAFYEMDICDLPLFVDAHEKLRRERLENQRLWTWLTMSPHLTKKIEQRKLCPFPWETEQMKVDAIRNMEQNRELLSKFLKGEIIDLNKKRQDKPG